MAPLVVGLVICWLLGSLFAGRTAVTALAPASISAESRSLWAKPRLRFLAGFLLWPLALFCAFAFAAFVTLFFWDLILYGPQMRDDGPDSA
jgi:hypothetical protein